MLITTQRYSSLLIHAFDCCELIVGYKIRKISLEYVIINVSKYQEHTQIYYAKYLLRFGDCYFWYAKKVYIQLTSTCRIFSTVPRVDPGGRSRVHPDQMSFRQRVSSYAFPFCTSLIFVCTTAPYFRLINLVMLVMMMTLRTSCLRVVPAFWAASSVRTARSQETTSLLDRAASGI